MLSDDRRQRALSVDPIGDGFVVAQQLHAVRAAGVWQPLDPLPAGCAGRGRQHDHIEVGGTVGDARLHHQCPRRGPSLRRGAGETDAALIDQVDENRCGRQQRRDRGDRPDRRRPVSNVDRRDRR